MRSLIVLWGVLVLTACGTRPTPPEPQQVLAVLRQYPGGTLIVDEPIDTKGGDETYRIIFQVQTTVEAAVAYYDPQLQALHFKGSVGDPRTLTYERLPLAYDWSFIGKCPMHVVDLGITATELHLIYGTGRCR